MTHDKALKTALLTIISFGVVLAMYLSGILNLFELKAYDAFSRLLNPAEAHEQIIMVEVDQRSLDALSAQSINWPWPRQVYAPIIEYLSEAEAVFIDILYTEPSSYGHEDDLILAESVQAAANVYLPVFLTNQDKVMSAADEEFVERIALKEDVDADISYRSALTPIDLLKKGVRGAGNVTISPDQDGVYRKVPLVFRLNGLRIPHFVLGHLIEKGDVLIRNTKLYLGDEPVPLKQGKLMLRFYTEQDPFPVFSAAEILDFYLKEFSSEEPAVPRSFFKGKYVFIGMTAPGLYDLKPTAVSSVSTGVLVHATALDNILNRTFITPIRSVYVLAFVFLICLVVSLIRGAARCLGGHPRTPVQKCILSGYHPTCRIAGHELHHNGDIQLCHRGKTPQADSKRIPALRGPGSGRRHTQRGGQAETGRREEGDDRALLRHTWLHHYL